MDQTPNLNARLIAALEIEALVLMDEARDYFDRAGHGERDRLAAVERVRFTCEALKVTTRLMHVVGWLASQRAGPDADSRMPAAPPGDADPAGLATLPAAATRIVMASRDLAERVRRLDSDLHRRGDGPGPARTLLGRLERAVGG